MATEPIKIDGLDQFVRNLRKLDSELPKQLRIGLNEAAQLIVDYARPRIPVRTGRAAKSVRVASTRSKVRVAEGGKRAPYMPWLDFGGKVGINRSVSRPFFKEGRFLYAGLSAERDKILARVHEALIAAAESAGVVID